MAEDKGAPGDDRYSNNTLKAMADAVLQYGAGNDVEVSEVHDLILMILQSVRLGYGSMVRSVEDAGDFELNDTTPVMLTGFTSTRPVTVEYGVDLAAGTLTTALPGVSLFFGHVNLGYAKTEEVTAQFYIDGVPFGIPYPMIGNGPTKNGGGMLVGFVDTGLTPRVSQIGLINQRGPVTVTVRSAYWLSVYFPLINDPV